MGLSRLELLTSRLSGVRSNQLSYRPMIMVKQILSALALRSRLSKFEKFGGDEENRTPDPLLARQVLSQLSYAPIMVTTKLSLCLGYPIKFEGCTFKTRQCKNQMSDLRVSLG